MCAAPGMHDALATGIVPQSDLDDWLSRRHQSLHIVEYEIDRCSQDRVDCCSRIVVISRAGSKIVAHTELGGPKVIRRIEMDIPDVEMSSTRM